MPTIFHRWESIKNALLSYDISDTIILDFNKSELVPQGTHEINRILAGDEWNHVIFGLILESFGFNLIRYKNIDIQNDEVTNVHSSYTSWKQKIKYILSLITTQFVRERDSFLLHTYLPFFSVQ